MNQSACPGHTLLVNKYYLDHLYNDVIVGGTRGPIAKATYWFNQNIIDKVVDTAGETVGQGRPVRLRQDRPGRHRGRRQRLRVLVAIGAVGELRKMQTGKVQQYAALLFAGAPILAGIFIVFV